jgi:hypothetical protein
MGKTTFERMLFQMVGGLYVAMRSTMNVKPSEWHLLVIDMSG